MTHRRRLRVVACVTALLLAPVGAAQAASWTLTGSLHSPRFLHAMSLLLPSGRVLVAGGIAGGDSAEVYSPATGSWTTTGSMSAHRIHFTLTLLRDGKVLAAGGADPTDPGPVVAPLASSEIYDPSTGTWTATQPMNTGRTMHTATLLPNGKVLVAGGVTSGDVITTTAELFDPSTRTWSNTGSMGHARKQATATVLFNGKVLAAGGYDTRYTTTDTAELYTPATGTWTSTGSLGTGRAQHSSILLFNGKVLAAAGVNRPEQDQRTDVSSAELYQPATGTWSYTGSLNTPREQFVMSYLFNGKVLVAGGESVNSYTNTAELYDFFSGTWSNTASMNGSFRWFSTGTLLLTGRVLVTGGLSNLDAFTPELYTP